MKEQGQIDSLIPLLCLREGSLQGAFDTAMSILRVSVQGFEICSQQLLARHAHDANVSEKILQFIHGCKCACTANLNWRSAVPSWPLECARLTHFTALSLESGRYSLGCKSLSDNVKLTL